MNQNELIQKLNLYLLDMDGTLYLGDRLFDFTVEFLQTLRLSGKRYLFMTNNSSHSVDDYILALREKGIRAAREDFVTSSQATAYYLHKYQRGKRLYVCGTESLIRELEMEGFDVVYTPEKAQCVVMGFDTELTFKKLKDICWLLSTRKDIPYIATNPDLVCPTEFGSVPDCGSVCQMIYNATGRRPVVIGKPSPLMPELAMERLGYKKEETCAIGDRIYTDVKCGLNAGITAILVMSGETTQAILNESRDKPDLVFRDCGEILDILKGQDAPESLDRNLHFVQKKNP